MVKVLRANPEDSEQIARCTRDAYSDEIFKFDDKKKISERPTADEVRQDIEDYDYYKIVLGDTIIGGVFIVEEDAQTVSVEDFCIDPVYQNRGYGKFVLEELERIHSAIKKWMLTTPVYSVGNQHLYEKHGYKRVKIDDYDGILCVYYEKIV